MNIYDISQLAGVSIATVSRVINGSDRVSARTRQKVLRVIEENGYTPNAFARGLGLNTMHTVGLLCAVHNIVYLCIRFGYAACRRYYHRCGSSAHCVARLTACTAGY